MENCIFCKIIKGEIPAAFEYEDDDMVVFKDISPKANKHYLAVPKTHYKLLADMTERDSLQLARIFKKIPTLQSKLGLQNGYRLIINQGGDAGQTVFHLHIHIMGGQELDFPDFRKN